MEKYFFSDFGSYTEQLQRKTEDKKDFRRCYTRQFSYNLSRNFVVPLQDKLHATLPSVTPLRNAGKIRCSVARIVAKSRTDFYFSQQLRHQKSCETC